MSERWFVFPLAAAMALGISFSVVPARGESLKTESRMPHQHDIPLRDADGNIITLPPLLNDAGKLQDARANPYSTAETCGRCHEYEMISQGWHFNAAKGNVKPGRPGEPWIFTDAATHTQIPLSYRGWAGTFKPADIGLSDFDFVNAFAHHFPGGGVADPAKPDPTDAKARRFLVTGPLQIDCLICHENDGHYNHEARFATVKGQNFKWASTTGAGLGIVGGFKSAQQIANGWSTNAPVPTNVPPIKYDREKFDVENNFSFQVARRAPNNNCYYCHTSETHLGDSRWHSDGDIHIRAGMLCVDCHRNGVNHMIVRGYEGEINDRAVTPDEIAMRARLLRRDNAALSEDDAKKLASTQLNQELGAVETLSCRGCHTGKTEAFSASQSLTGRLGAPKPIHKGLPPIHLEKLTCTACHSGPVVGAQEQIVHTSLAHKLGLPAQERGGNTPPVIVEPVFLRNENERIAAIQNGLAQLLGAAARK